MSLVNSVSMEKNVQKQHILVSGADPEIFMRGGPTKLVILVKDEGVQPQKFPKMTFF